MLIWDFTYVGNFSVGQLNLRIKQINESNMTDLLKKDKPKLTFADSITGAIVGRVSGNGFFENT